MMIIRVNIIIYLMLYFLGTECELMLLNDTIQLFKISNLEYDKSPYPKTVTLS